MGLIQGIEKSSKKFLEGCYWLDGFEGYRGLYRRWQGLEPIIWGFKLFSPHDVLTC